MKFDTESADSADGIPRVHVHCLCRYCGERATARDVPTERYLEFLAGAHVMKALAELPLESQEVLLAGAHLVCSRREAEKEHPPDDPWDDVP